MLSVIWRFNVFISRLTPSFFIPAQKGLRKISVPRKPVRFEARSCADRRPCFERRYCIGTAVPVSPSPAGETHPVPGLPPSAILVRRRNLRLYMTDTENKSSLWKKQLTVIWTGQLFSLLTSAVVQFSIVWWITEKTSSATYLSIAMIASVIPMAVAGPFAGVIVDRMNRKLIMIMSDASIAAATVILSVSLLFSETMLWPVFVVLAVRSFFSAFHWPAMSAVMPLIVPEAQLTRVAGVNQALQSVSYLAGPAVGAIALSVWTLPSIILLDVIGAACGIVSLFFVRIPPTPAVKKTVPETAAAGGKNRFFTEMADGLKAIAGVKGTRSLIAAMTVFTVTLMPISTLFPLMVLTHFNGTAWHNGIVETAFSGGMLVGGLILGTWGGPKRKVILINMTLVLFGLTIAVMGFLPPELFAVFAVLSLFMGMCAPFYNGGFMALIQSRFDPGLLGRVFSLVNTITSLASPVGIFVAGIAADRVGLPVWFVLSGCVMVVTGVSCFFVPSIMKMEKISVSAVPACSEVLQ